MPSTPLGFGQVQPLAYGPPVAHTWPGYSNPYRVPDAPVADYGGPAAPPVFVLVASYEGPTAPPASYDTPTTPVVPYGYASPHPLAHGVAAANQWPSYSMPYGASLPPTYDAYTSA